VRASVPGDPADLYLVRADLTAAGRFAGIRGIYDLTHSPAADESVPIVRGDTALYASSMDGVVISVHALDLGGEPEPDVREPTTRLARIESALTNYQETGQLAGIGRRGWSLDPSASRVELGFRDDQLDVVADGHAIALPARGTTPISGAELVRAQP